MRSLMRSGALSSWLFSMQRSTSPCLRNIKECVMISLGQYIHHSGYPCSLTVNNQHHVRHANRNGAVVSETLYESEGIPNDYIFISIQCQVLAYRYTGIDVEVGL